MDSLRGRLSNFRTISNVEGQSGPLSGNYSLTCQA